MSDLKIMVVDDDEDDRYMLGEAFKQLKESVSITLISSGIEAIEMLHMAAEEELPCLIILDYNMPGLTGVDVLAIIYEHPLLRSIPVIVFSTSNSPALMQKCLQEGAIAYRIKPADFTALVETASEMLDMCKVKG